MPALKNPKHEAFCQGIAEGMSGCASYRAYVAEPGALTTTCMCNASQLLSDPKVSQRVKELRTNFRDVLEHKLGVKQETIARFLVSVLDTPVEEVEGNSPLAQEIKRSRKFVGRGEEAEEWEVEQIKTPSKMEAAEKLNKMAGWYEPDKIETDGKMEIIIRKE